MMAVVLGRPGAGCTTLLKALANQRQDYHKVLGDVWYDDFTPEEMYKHYRGDIQYSPEDDVHFATLTVRQTLDFAAKTRTPQARLAARAPRVRAVTRRAQTTSSSPASRPCSVSPRHSHSSHKPAHHDFWMMCPLSVLALM